MSGWLNALLWAGGLVAVLSVVVLYYLAQDKKLRDYGLARIEAMSLAGDDKLVFLALADYHHPLATNSGPRVTKKSTGIPSKELYWTVLKGLIEADLAGMPKRPDFRILKDNSFRRRVGDVHYLAILSKDGSYVMTRYWDVFFKNRDESWKASGTWQAAGDRLQWDSVDAGKISDRILRMGPAGFVIMGDSNEVEFWRFNGSKDNLESSAGKF